MFKLAFAQYICDNMVRMDMTFKDLFHRSGVPVTTLHSYSRGRTNNPDEEYCDKIAAAFGDSPDVIRQMRRDALESTAHENKLIAHADDKDLLEQMSGLIRANALEVLEAYKCHALEQQDQIIRHADARVAQAEQRCAEQIELERSRFREICDRHERGAMFLKSCVFYLSFALGIVSALLIIIASYAVYAYHTFDRADPTQGLYRAGAGVNSHLIMLVASLAALIIGVTAFAVIRHRRTK